MKERVFKYLLEAGKGVAATQILGDVFDIHSPNPHSSDSVLAGFLGEDPRFVIAEGLWHLHSLPQEPIRFGFDQAAALNLQELPINFFYCTSIYRSCFFFSSKLLSDLASYFDEGYAN